MKFGAVIAAAISTVLAAHGALAAGDRSEERFNLKDTAMPADKAAAIKTLNDYLRGLAQDARITDCQILLQSHPGTAEDVYAGVCRLQSGRSVALCGDTGIGQFALSENVAPERNAVVEFVRNNCAG
jgi:hypothetical protein